MVSLADILPPANSVAPSSHKWAEEEDVPKKTHLTVFTASHQAPPYGHRGGWVPRTQADFVDGGAFPEILLAQYPFGLGQKKKPSNALALQVDSTGKVKYDAIARQGQRKDKVVHSKPQDLLPADAPNQEDDPEMQRPDEEDVEETTEKTREALEKIVSGKIAAAMPVKCAEKTGPAQYIRYTPSQQGVAYNSGATQRVIRMVEAQRDPMSPPRFNTTKKIPRGPPSPPAPVLHSPSRKVTAKEQSEWKIPPCISNWKNAKGYTIPLDKRLAADGRGLQGVHINENFAKLAEALYIADRKAREAVEMRAQLEKTVLEKEKTKKEESLRALAQKARDERAGIRREVEKDTEVKERDQLRHERHKDRQRDKNIARAAPERRSKLEKQRDRDISEQIALGMPAKKRTDDVQFDQRLFNQSKGLDSGYGLEDDTYNVYDKPWRENANIGNSIYRPTKNVDKELYGDELENIMKTKRFTADKEFAGTDHQTRRDGPVQFEKEEESDPFGLDKFLTEAKKASSKRPAEPANRSTTYTEKKRRRD